MAQHTPPPTNPGPQIPDLDLGVDQTSAPKAKPGVATRPLRAPSRVDFDFNASLDDDLMTGLAGAPLALDLPAGANVQAPAHRPVSGERRWPTGITPAPDAVLLDRALVRPLCSWGEPPKTWWQTPFYALLVYQGHQDLLREVKPITAELQQVEAQRDQCLSALATQLRGTLASNPGFASALQELQATDAMLDQARIQLQHEQTQSNGEIQALDQAIANTETNLTKLEAALHATRQILGNAEMDLQREQARIQRLGIERRNIEQTPVNNPAKEEQLAALSHRASVLLPTVDAYRISVRSRQAEQMQTEATIAQVRRELANLKLRQATVGRELSSSINGASVAMTQACEQQGAALAALGRSILHTKGLVPVDDAKLDELVHYDDSVAMLCQREQLYLAAMGSYDRAAVKRGLLLSAMVLSLLVIWCIWRGFS